MQGMNFIILGFINYYKLIIILFFKIGLNLKVIKNSNFKIN